MQYTYNKLVSPSKLETEIKDSFISVALDYIVVNDQVSDVFFKAALSAGEEDTLNNIVEDHDPTDTSKLDTVIINTVNRLTGIPEQVMTQWENADGKVRVLASNRPILPGKTFYNYFTSAGDDLENYLIGKGTAIAVQTQSGIAESYVDVEFLSTVGVELIGAFGGSIAYDGAGWGDSVSVDVVAKVTPTTTGGGDKYYSLDGEKLKFDLETGTHALTGIPVFVENYAHTGWWDLTEDWDAVFSPVQSGGFDWFVTEQTVAHYFNHIAVYGSGGGSGILLTGPEVLSMPYGYKIRLLAYNNSNTVWKVWGVAHLYRERLA